MPRWTAEARERHSILMKTQIRLWQPWARSTGARTSAGKARCSLNAVKHGGCAATTKRATSAFRAFCRANKPTFRQQWREKFPESGCGVFTTTVQEACKRFGIKY